MVFVSGCACGERKAEDINYQVLFYTKIHEFVSTNDGFHTKNDGFHTKNDEFHAKMMNFIL